MGIIKRQAIKSSLVTYFGVLLGAFNTLWLYPKYLETEEIGLISILTTISLIIAPIAQLGVNGVILKYLPFVKGNKDEEQSFAFFILLIPMVGFILSMLILFLSRDLLVANFSDKSSLLVDYLFAVIPFSFILIGRNISDTLARAFLRITMPKLFKEVVLRVGVLLAVTVYTIKQFPVKYLVIGYVLAFGINFLFSLVYTLKLTKFRPNFTLSFLKTDFKKQALVYGFYIILSGFAGMLVTKIDSWMISSMLGLSSNGIYTIALYIGLVIEMPKRSLNLISLPVVGREMKNGNTKEVESLYKKSSLNQLIIGSVLFICVWINVDDLFSLIPNGEQFKDGKFVVLFIGLAVLFDMATGINNEIILMSNFYKWNIYIMLFLIALAYVNNLILIPIYGITGAALATAISIFLFNVIKFTIVLIKLKIQPFSLQTMKALLLIIVCYLLTFILPNVDFPILNIFIKSVVVITFMIATTYFFKVSSDINELLMQVISKVYKRK